MAEKNKVEVREPETAERLLQALSIPGMSTMKAAAIVGVPRKTAEDFRKRNGGVIQDGRQTKWADLVPLLKDGASEAFTIALDKLDDASIKELAIFGAIAIDKGFLIEGRATHNISVVHEHRHSMPRLGQALQDALVARQSPTVIEGELLDSE